MKLSATVTPHWEGRGEATHLRSYRDFELKLIYNVQCLQANRPCRRAFLYIYMYIHGHELPTIFAALSIAGYLPDNRYDQQNNCQFKNERRQVI